MAITSLGKFGRTRRGALAKSALGLNPRISPVYRALGTSDTQPQVLPSQSQTLPELQPGYGFGELAQYEEQRRRALGPQIEERLGGLRSRLESEYGKALEKYKAGRTARRGELATSLGETARKQFALDRPELLEDLHRRGLLTSPTELARTQTQAEKELALGTERRLSEFDVETRSKEEEINNQLLTDIKELEAAKVAATSQSEQDALDAALDLRRGELESRLSESAAGREEALARDLAKKARKQGIIESLIGAGGGILGGVLPFLLGRGGGGGGGGALVGAETGQVVPGIGAVGTGVPAGGGLGTALPLLGLTAGGILGYKSLSDKGKSIVAPLVNPLKTAKTLGKGAQSIGKSIAGGFKKAFCFDAQTSIEMEDGSMRPISKLYVGSRTKGGVVESIRISLAKEGTRYEYKGVYVTGSHAVKEDGKWIRIKDSTMATPLNGEGIVWSLVTSNHRVFINGIEFADEHETDDYEELTIDESLERLNKKERSLKKPILEVA